MTSHVDGLPFTKYQSSVHSENGEDGVIAELHKRMGVADGADNWCVELGAWDGVHRSNTFALVERGWSAVYIEGDRQKYGELLETARRHPRIVTVNAFVSRSPTDELALDAILRPTPVPPQFGVLSIDIDSYDCDVWESLTDYRPAIVVIEINSSVPPGVIWRHSDKTMGNTFSATHNVARKKGYTLVCHTGNLIFVRDDEIEKVNLEQRYVDYPELLFQFDGYWMRDNLFPYPRPPATRVRDLARKVVPPRVLSAAKRVVGIRSDRATLPPVE